MKTSKNQSKSAVKFQEQPSLSQIELESQVIDLQMTMTHLELTMEQLDEVITRQDHEIRTLQRQLQLVHKQIESDNADTGIAPFDVVADRPPHY